jgi:D-beta-D-heptose 7-phosphate kinase / D-beta-D-heptose 1-phosphate adenosyltransferase
VLSDYAKGAVTSDIAQYTIRAARERSVPVVVDPKQRSFAAYRGATVITPNLHELEAAAPGYEGLDVERAAASLLPGIDGAALLVTRSSEGMTLFRLTSPPFHVPAMAKEVYDVTGAGDTVVAVLAACLGSGRDLVDACRLANVAAGIAVSHPGTYVVHADELATAWRGLSHKVLTREAARRRTDQARRQGRKVVFTNGCFDLLHPGHIQTLEYARSLGDALIVAINSDSSVRQLKGPGRPVIPERERAEILAALECVDAVLIFDDLTPQRVAAALLPDILVKGGDWPGDQIIGRAEVEAAGGRVVSAPVVAGYSTTEILRKIRDSAAPSRAQS